MTKKQIKRDPTVLQDLANWFAKNSDKDFQVSHSDTAFVIVVK